MRRALLLSLIILLSQPFVSATDISDDSEEASSGTLSGNYTVTNGATWTVSGDYEIAENTAIVIEEGATMVVSGSMDAVAPPKLNLAGTANVLVPVGNLGDSGVLRIDFADEILYGIDIEINNETSVNWTGTQFDWNGDLDVENITVNITTHPFQITSISSITLSAQGTTPVLLEAEQMSGNGTSLVIPDRNNAWSIDVQGSLIVTGSIFGAGITCSGTCTLNGAQMTSTGPIEVMGSISVTDSTLSGGISDEDIIVWDDASVTWTNSTGTGGVTDNWVNILTTRTIGIENGYVVFYGYDMGYDSISTSPLGDNNTFEPANMGDNVIEIALDERDRMIRWQDGDGVVHEESASGLVVLSTPWGDYEHQIPDLPKVNHFDVSLDLPSLSFDSLVESDDENNVNSRLGIMATVTNNGDASANFLIDCISNGTDANVGVNVPYSAGAGETIEIPMNWDSAVEGELTLECTIFVPYHFDGFDVVSSGTATTNPVTWSIEDDNSTNLLLPIAIGLVLAVGVFAFMLRKNMQNEAMKEYSQSIEQIDDSDEDIGEI
ncbi:MAG: hypothetical protein MKZ58_07125, partial [Candidatus Poseidoniaceae archaeon]|nr:hypothetical protein [Candidatus Poseidoniaceae archaeon]